jgi:hypothetical protein
VVDEVQDDGPAVVEELGEADALSRVVSKDQVKRDRLAEVLIDPDVLEAGRR